jgi:hypothetical protein
MGKYKWKIVLGRVALFSSFVCFAESAIPLVAINGGVYKPQVEFLAPHALILLACFSYVGFLNNRIKNSMV